jgi:hypothetical protein
MQLQQLPQVPHSLFRPQPPPLWYVTNGELTVGPVLTGLLMRGVEHGRVPEYCHVRALRGTWRQLVSVREIAALNSKVSMLSQPLNHDALSEMSRPFQRIRDEDELCHDVTRLSIMATGAESAMFHFVGRKTRSLTTRCVLGPVSTERVGYTLSEHDLVLRSARLARPVLGPPYGPTEDALAIRFATSKGGVGGAAMIPFYVDGTLMAMLELSRPGHAFRRTDLQRAERIVHRALRQRVN